MRVVGTTDYREKKGHFVKKKWACDTDLSFVREQHGRLDKLAAEELGEESEVDDGGESDEVDVGGHVDKAEAGVADGVAPGLRHAGAHGLNKSSEIILCQAFF